MKCPFKVGDEVKDLAVPDYGIGVVLSVDSAYKQYKIRFENALFTIERDFIDKDMKKVTKLEKALK